MTDSTSESLAVHAPQFMHLYELFVLTLNKELTLVPREDLGAILFQHAQALVKLAESEAENQDLKAIAVNLHWMARRYADGRCTYAPGLVNQAVRKLQALGVELNLCGERTPWARDGMGPGYSGLSPEEYALGEPLDQWISRMRDEEVQALADQIKTLQEKLDIAKGFIYDVANNYDCDSDAHKYGTHCPQCLAQACLAELEGES